MFHYKTLTFSFIVKILIINDIDYMVKDSGSLGETLLPSCIGLLQFKKKSWPAIILFHRWDRIVHTPAIVMLVTQFICNEKESSSSG